LAALTREEAEAFLYREARLLDERRFEEWLELFTADGRYWLPLADGTDPEVEPSILYDDSRLRAQRVHRILHQPHHAQLPPSRTVHSVTNVEVEPAPEPDAVVVRCVLLLYELRPGHTLQVGLGRLNVLAARCEYHLRHETDWRIALKKVVLIDHDQPQPNLTFLV
jgi:3-phenylpropionate/cinnamic acid dioxygenase small subunit